MRGHAPMTQSVYQSELDPDAADAASAGHGPDAVDEWYSARCGRSDCRNLTRGTPRRGPSLPCRTAGGCGPAVGAVPWHWWSCCSSSPWRWRWRLRSARAPFPPVTTHAPATDPGVGHVRGSGRIGNGEHAHPGVVVIDVPPSSVLSLAPGPARCVRAEWGGPHHSQLGPDGVALRPQSVPGRWAGGAVPSETGPQERLEPGPPVGQHGTARRCRRAAPRGTRAARRCCRRRPSGSP